jgi:hypothetical protein
MDRKIAELPDRVQAAVFVYGEAYALATHPTAIMPHDEALILIEKLLAFYASVTPQELEAINLHLEALRYEQDKNEIAAARALSPRTKSSADDPRDYFLDDYPQYSTRDGKRGYVYLLQAKNGLIKIGQTVNLTNRMRRHRRIWKGEFDFSVVGIVPSGNCEKLEATLHEKYAALREARRVTWVSAWFHLSPEDVAYIKSLGARHGGN